MGTHPPHGIVHGSPAGRQSKSPARRKAEVRAEAPDPPASLTQEQIARRAYEIYEARGDSGGDALGDWLTAERELRERVEASACSPSRTERDIYH
jgi:hypothetical protein